jgi:hypothetical protein
MSNHAANPAAVPYVSPQFVLWALPNRTQDHPICHLPSSAVGHRPSRGEAVWANLIGRERNESFVRARVCRYVSRLLFGHGFGASPAPCGSSLFCFNCVALRVTVSLQILFGKYAEKISPEPP